ncbi:MAG: hypothetical protein R3Y26_02595 [Rikenellaceae bacterium]
MKLNILNSILIIILYCVTSSLESFAQDTSKTPIEYFEEYNNTIKQNNMIRTALPTLEECRTIFKENAATIYFNNVVKLKDMLDNGDYEDNEEYVTCKVISISTNDIIQGKQNYPGGMNNIKDKLLPNVKLYEVTYLKNKNDKYGMRYNYFIETNDRWVFIFKPWRMF